MDVEIRGKNYTKVVDLNGDTYLLYPFDIYGNVMGQMTVEFELTTNNITVVLPSISTLGIYKPTINIVVTTNPSGYTADIVCDPADAIGSYGDLPLYTQGQNAVLQPITSINSTLQEWSAVFTA